MSLPVVLRPEAEHDLRSARDWYNRQRAGLGDEFRAQVTAVLEQIGTMPEMFALKWQDVRSCRMPRFPYIVYYRSMPDRVEVLAVLHGSRDQSAFRSRH